MRVLGFGTYDASAHPRAAVLLDGLRERGHDVRELNEPMGLSTAERVEILQKPWLVPRLGWRVLRCWARLARAGRAERGSVDAVLVGYLGHFDVLLARRVFPDALVVLDHLISAEGTARDRGSTNVVVLRLLRLLDRWATGAADLVVVDTEEHRSLVEPGRSADVVVAAVGAPASWFQARRRASRPESTDPERTDPLRVVFFGLFTPLQGAPVVAAAAALLASDPVALTMIGTGQDLDAARTAAGPDASVEWVPWVDSDDLPSLVATYDVCLGIFGTTTKAQHVVPNKVFQGAAAGLAVVTSGTAPQRRALDGRAVLVPAGDPAALADALRDLAVDRERLVGLQRGSAELADAAMTAGAVTAELDARLRLRLGGAQIG